VGVGIWGGLSVPKINLKNMKTAGSVYLFLASAGQDIF
jgi:hypothetical protein